MSSMKLFAAVSGLIVLIWVGGALYIDGKTSKLREEFIRKKELTGSYEALASLWSERAAKRALKQMERMLGIYSIVPKTERRGGKKLYTFTLEASKADKVLGRILNSNIVIRSFLARRTPDGKLEVRLEVAL